MSATAALWRAIVAAAAAGTLRQSILDGIELVTWGLEHPGIVSAMVDMTRMSRAGAPGGSAAVEGPAMERADGTHMGGN